MMYMAFTIGFFGSIHCIGMCGPLALGIVRFENVPISSMAIHAFLYNIGRVITYALIGAIFGLLGEGVFITGLQKSFSILSGIILIALFLFSLDLEKLLFKSEIFNNFYNSVSTFIISQFKNGAQNYPLFVGLLNGLLPCGLVYLALAGSLTSGSILNGSLFMIFFGLGTIPAMMALMIMGSRVKGLSKYKLLISKRVFPFLHLLLGVFIIYRGLKINMPIELDFWSAIQHPIMCH